MGVMGSSSMIIEPLQFGKWLIVGGIAGSLMVSILQNIFSNRSARWIINYCFKFVSYNLSSWNAKKLNFQINSISIVFLFFFFHLKYNNVTPSEIWPERKKKKTQIVAIAIVFWRTYFCVQKYFMSIVTS